MKDSIIDPATGTELTPGNQGKYCLGNGNFPGFECCCDECDYFLLCFPNWEVDMSCANSHIHPASEGFGQKALF